MPTYFSVIPTRFALCLLSLASLFQVKAQETTVTFKANMNHQITLEKFDPATESVDIAGNFNGWGDPTLLLAKEENTDIYTATAELQIGSVIEFKARINGEWNGREEFSGGGPNRSYTVEANGIVAFWYNDEVPDDQLDVRISASSVFVQPGETIQLFDQSGGDPVSWQWTIPGAMPATSTVQNPVVTFSSEGEYSVTLEIANEMGETANRTFTGFIKVGAKDTYWWNDAIFYEIFVRSFQDSDGDGKGDFQGLISRLDYLNDGDPTTHDDLGVTGIWLMPVQEAPSYHGYDATDYRKIEPDFGTNADFILFMEEAHKRGIRVIVDYVMNHSSSQHPWFVDSRSSVTSPKRDWYVWRPTHPGYNGPWGQPVWHSSGGQHYYGVFWSGMPDLNYENPSVRQEMFETATFWLDEMKVDGFRLDAVKFIYEVDNVLEDTPETFQFWKDFRTHYKSVNPDAFAVGEAWTSTATVKKYVEGSGLDFCFEFDLANAILSSTNNGNASPLKTKIQEVIISYPYMQFGTFLTNHDINRVMDILGNNESKAKLAASMLLTLPGIPFIYYGEEIGMNGSKPDENIRTPMHWDGSPNGAFTTGNPWRPLNDDYTQKNVEAQMEGYYTLLQLYRQFIALRNNHVALRQGDFQLIETNQNHIMAFERVHESERLWIVSNFSVDNIDDFNIDAPSDIPEDHILIDLLNGYQIPKTTDGKLSINLGPQQTHIYKWVSMSGITTSVTFQVDMTYLIDEGIFKPGTDTPDIIGSFNNLAAGNGDFQLLDPDGDGVYEITIHDLDIGSSQVYKYRMRGKSDGTEEYAGDGNFRLYHVLDGINVVKNRYEYNLVLGLKEDKMQVTLFPVPSHDQIIIQVEGYAAQPIDLQMMDVTGRIIFRKANLTLDHDGRLQLPLEGIDPGNYFITLHLADQHQTHRIIVGE